MAMEGLLILACAGTVMAAAPAVAVNPPAADDHDSNIVSTLAVQTAMEQAREFLLQHNPKAAVEALEAQLPHINGNRTYLVMLRDAYQSYINELHLKNQEGTAQEFIRKLLILEPGAARHIKPSAAAPPASKPDIVRSSIPDEEDPFQPSPNARRNQARSLLDRAEQAFAAR